MLENTKKIVVIFIIGMIGGIFADQILWPYFIERPLFYKYRLDQAPVYINKTEQIFVEENGALQNAVEKVEKSVAGIKIEKDNGKIIIGSGIIATSDGLIVTSSDLISQKGKITVYTDGKARDYQILKKDAKNNLAVMKVSETNLPTIGFADFGSLRFGQRVFLIGAVLKEDNNLSKIVNEGVIKTYDEKSIETNIVEKNDISGSPLFNIKGELVGLNMVNTDNNVSSIPINKIREFLGF